MADAGSRQLGGRRSGAVEWLLVSLACAGLLAALQTVGETPAAPRADALRYLDYALNLADHGTFGLGESDSDSGGAPVPGRANTPLYPLFLAAALELGGADTAALRCWLRPPATTCAAVPSVVYLAQVMLAAGGLGVLWLLARALGGSRRLAAFCVAAALLSAQPQTFASQLLTENLSIPLFALLTLAVLRVRDGTAARWDLLLGLALGLLTLTRPEFFYLALATLALRLALALIAAPAQRRAAWRAAALTVTACLVLVLPWLARNVVHFGDPALTATYGGQILAQRVQYNRMTAAEYGAAFVYWLPDFGDSLARRLLPAACYRRLDFRAGSFYADGLPYFARLAAERGSDAAATQALLREDVLGHPLKHALVTLPLAWRAVFVAKLWGLGGLLAFATVVLRGGTRRGDLLLASAPAWFMLLLYAAVSVAVPRYAVCFVPVFSLALALCLERLFTRRGVAA